MKCKDNAPLKIVYSDNHLLIVVKPPGIPTQTHKQGEVSCEVLAKQCTHKKFLQPVHRLDKQVGGLVLFALTGKALSRLQAQQRARKIEKTYLALVEGIPKEKEATLEHDLVHGHLRAHIKPGGKRSLLHYRQLKTIKGNALLEIHLITGRYHQIRAQLAAIGHPILGDTKYGATQSYRDGIALFHSALKFVHPVTGEEISVTTSWEGGSAEEKRPSRGRSRRQRPRGD